MTYGPRHRRVSLELLPFSQHFRFCSLCSSGKPNDRSSVPGAFPYTFSRAAPCSERAGREPAAAGSVRKEREWGFHRNHDPDLPAGSGSRWHHRDRAGIATVPISPRVERSDSHPTSCIFHPQRCPGIISLTLGRKSPLIPKLPRRSTSGSPAGFPYQPTCDVVVIPLQRKI